MNCGQSYKASTIVFYESRVVNVSNLLVITTTNKIGHWTHFPNLGKNRICLVLGNGCCTVGRAVASKTRGPQIESSHRQTLYHPYTVNCIEKTKIKIKIKMPEMAHLCKEYVRFA